MRKVFFLYFLLTLTSPAFANSVYYCTSKQVVHITEREVRTYVKEKFKLSVTPQKIEFSDGGYGGYFMGKTMDIQFFADHSMWSAASDYSKVLFMEPSFVYSMLMYSGEITSIQASCSKL